MVLIITPCYNEEKIITKLLNQIQEVSCNISETIEILLINDCSTDNTLSEIQAFKGSLKIHVLDLNRNVGHQSAIYKGLVYAKQIGADNYIIMDSDGEDNPNAISQLITFKIFDIVKVIRGKRSEGFIFRLFYYIYKYIFKIITKNDMNFGNYCMISNRVVDVLVENSFIHLAANLSKMKYPSTSIIYDRAKRIGGQSKMNIEGLIHHAFKSFIEYSNELLMTFLKLFLVLFFLFIISIGSVLYLKIFTNLAITGWASVVSLLLLNAALISIGFFVIGILLLNIKQKKNL